MSLPTPNWVTTAELVVSVGGSAKSLPPQSFVRPISWTYLPSHIQRLEEDKSVYLKMDPDTQTYCYTHYGIVLLYWKDLRRT